MHLTQGVGLIGLGAAMAIIAPALAQTAATAPAKDKEAPKARESVTVAAQRPSVQILADRTVYSMDTSIQSSSGSLSDALRDLPSVDVDIQGNVSLRGDSGVTILIDGKKSPLLAGNRADALQQIPASMVDRIEVITNPSAEFRAEGSAGIINIVLRKDRELISSGIVRANLGSEGRANITASGHLKLGPVRLNGGYGERRDTQHYTASTLRSDGTVLRSQQDASGKSVNAGRNAFASAVWDLNGLDELQWGGNYNGSNGHSESHEHNISALNGTDTKRNGLSFFVREGAGGQLGYRHKFAAKDETLNIDATHFVTWGRNNSDYNTLATATGAGTYWQSRRSSLRESHTGLKSGYTLPVEEDGKFKAGYELQADANRTDNQGLWRDPKQTDWVTDSAYTNVFELERTTHAGYLSYEDKFGPFSVMGGLRLEEDLLNTRLKSTGEEHDTATLGFYPSVHISYAFADTKQIRLSYSRRMNRPQNNMLNPARYSSDAFNVWGGNPYLRPEQADSYEASYRYMGEKTDAVITGFYRATYHGFTSVYRYISDTVLLTTTDNLAHRMASGVETTVNLTLIEGLSIRSTAMLAYSEFNPGATGVGKKQTGLNWNFKGGLQWQATPDDLVQLNANHTGKQRFSQGYTDPNMGADMGVRHRFGGGLTAVGSVANLFESWDSRNVVESAGLHQESRRSRPGRVYYIGLVYTFGGARDTERSVSTAPEERGVPGVP